MVMLRMKFMPTHRLLYTVLITCAHVVLSVVHPDGVSQVTHYQDELGNYKFDYTVSSIDGEHFHRSDKDADGRIVGSYGLTESDGRQRVVDYVADHAGFRARIRSNEPGLASGQSAAVSVEKSGPVPISPLDFAASDQGPSGSGFVRSNTAASDPGPERRVTHLKYAASNQGPTDENSESNPSASDPGPEGRITQLKYATADSSSDKRNTPLEYAASDPSSSRLANYGQRIKETTSKVVYARPFEEEQYRRRLPISSSRSNDDRSRSEDAPYNSPFTSNRRRTSQTRNSDVYGPKVEVEDTLIGDGLPPVYRPPLDPFNARRPLVTSRATSIARPLPIFTPQPSTPPYGGFENRNPFSVSTDNPIPGVYPFPHGSRTDDGVYPAVSLFNIHGGLGNMFPLLPPPPPPGIVRDPVIGLAPPELVLRELMALDGQRVPGHPDLVFKVITAQNGIQVVPVDPLTGQPQNVPLVPLYDPLNGEQRAIQDRNRNYEFKFENFDGPASRRPFRPFDREPGSFEGTTRANFDENNVNRDRPLPGTIRRRPVFLGPRPGADSFEGSRTNFDDDFPLPGRFSGQLPRTAKGTRYDSDVLGPPINSRGYRSAENSDDDENGGSAEERENDNIRASTPTT